MSGFFDKITSNFICDEYACNDIYNDGNNPALYLVPLDKQENLKGSAAVEHTHPEQLLQRELKQQQRLFCS